MSDHFDKMYAAGAKIGFAKGGQVKDTGNMPASKGDSQQEIEAGGHGKLKPGYKHGGKTKGKGGAAKMAAKGVKKLNKMKVHSKKPLVGK